MVTYKSLRNGTWGVLSTSLVRRGDVVEVLTKKGALRHEIIDAVIWTDRQNVWICSVKQSMRQPRRLRAASPEPSAADRLAALLAGEVAS